MIGIPGLSIPRRRRRASFTGAYDAVPSIVAAYGMRRLRSAYTGSLSRLRRSSDNAESDFGYTSANVLDTDAITAWLAAVTGYYVRRYDQSGNGNNATQTTATSQPQYINDDDGVRPYHDRSDDSLSIASLTAGTYTVGIATWSGVQVFTHKQNSTGSYSLNPADAYEYVVINSASLSGSELSALQTALQAARPVAVNSADVMRVWSSSTSVNLSVTEAGGSAGLTWELGDGQTASGTSCVKTLAAAPDWIILRATDKTKIQQIGWGNKNLFGQLPDLSALTALTAFYCQNNQLTGSIPSLSSNTALTTFYCNYNQLTGSIPSLSSNTALTAFICNTNQLTGYSGGGVTATLGNFWAQDNQLSQAAVDAILADFVAANKTTGTRTLNLGGTGNATPSAAGLADKSTLQSRGWTVTTN